MSSSKPISKKQAIAEAKAQEEFLAMQEKFRLLNAEDFSNIAAQPRRRSREAALMMLFQLDLGGNTWNMAEYTLDNLNLKEDNAEFATDLTLGTFRALDDIDKIISKYSREWDMERLCGVDKNILRLGVFEILQQSTPIGIVINEAVELAKKFGTADSGSFVNAMLDNIYNHEIAPNHKAEGVDAE